MSLNINGTTGLTFNNGSTQNVGGVGTGSQTWQDVTANRSAGTTYTNSTGKPILIIVSAQVNSKNTFYTYIFVDGVRVSYAFGGGGADSYYALPYSVIVPNGSTYSVTNAGGISIWTELR
jgi:hypothetical protein